MPNPTAAPPYESATNDVFGDFIMPLVEIQLTAEVKTAKGVGGVKYAKWTAELKYGDERKEGVAPLRLSATDAHQTIHTRGAVLAAVAGLAALKRRCAVQLITDSEYLLSGATTWLPMGMSLGWHSGPKAARIRNHDLWGQLRDLAARHDIHWIGPRSKGEYADTMPEIKTEIRRRTIGDGPDTGYLYAGNVLPWDEALGAYRAFSPDEMKDSSLCLNVGNTDDNSATPLTAKERQTRKKIIQRIAEQYRPEHIRPTPLKASDTTAAPPATPTTLEPAKVRQIFAEFESPGGTITLLKYPRADARFRYPTAKTARLELAIGTEQ